MGDRNLSSEVVSFGSESKCAWQWFLRPGMMLGRLCGRAFLGFLHGSEAFLQSSYQVNEIAFGGFRRRSLPRLSFCFSIDQFLHLFRVSVPIFFWVKEPAMPSTNCMARFNSLGESFSLAGSARSSMDRISLGNRRAFKCGGQIGRRQLCRFSVTCRAEE
jgi:hypothetical protein